MKNIVLLIDINNIFAKFYFAGKSNPNSTFTSAKCADLIVSYIFDLISFFSATHCCCIFDCAGPNFRYDIYPDYKKTRKPKPEDYSGYRNLLKERLRGAGIPQISSKTLEAEDSMNVIIRGYQNIETKKGQDWNLFSPLSQNDFSFIVISDDKDCQLLKKYPNCKIYKKVQKDKIGFSTPAVISNIPEYCKISESDTYFIEKYKLFFSLTGDSADNIPGVPNFGPIKANFIISKLNSYDELKKFILSDTLNVDSYTLFNSEDKLNISKCLLTIKEHEKLLDISYKLFTLYEPSDTFFVDIKNWKI